MADIDRALFAESFAAALKAVGLTQGAAARAWPAANAAMISRALNRKALEAGNFLLLCSLAGLDPFNFLIIVKQRRTTRKAIVKRMRDQTLTEGDKRETQEHL